MGTDDVYTLGLVQVFAWGSQRIKTIVGVEGRGRKMLKRCEKANYCFILLLRMTVLKLSE